MHIVIPLFPRYTTLDAIGPYEVLRFIPDAEITFAAAETDPVPADSGALAITHTTPLNEIETCDIVVVPGGPGSRAENKQLVAWLSMIHPKSRWTTSVCTGALVLGSAGLLKGLDAATHWNPKVVQRLEELGARYVTDRVVFDDEHRIVTSAGVSAGIDMALALAARITDQVTAEAIQLAIQYDPQPPFDSGSPDKATENVRQRALELLGSKTT
ncbi:DJ-1/PfpI family protein [Nocardia arthritidis]|uniref:DJ-1/PfpI family protein n=1 Tax=Nocardia arthritidis TaxID=228602 RepID=A0A6G9YQX6_9NOCA|nr:DJ-1/PfpI family protein [Nocardia arthritidis]QIS15520.1 DJ-1/PfpI family protein [Nocardia arthritidis]